MPNRSTSLNPFRAVRRDGPTTPTPRVRSGVVLSLLAVGALTVFIGCRSYSGLPAPVDSPFAGPPIADELGPEDHLLVAQLPTPGWQFTLDASREALRRRQVFVTFRKPQPGVIYTQQVVTQRLSTGVPTSVPIDVLARVVEFDARPDASTPHAPVTELAPFTKLGVEPGATTAPK